MTILLSAAGCFRVTDIAGYPRGGWPGQPSPNVAVVTTSSGATLVASLPKMISSRDPAGQATQWDFAVTFKNHGSVRVSIDRIGRRYIDTRGQVWSSEAGEWESINTITIPGGASGEYTSWVRQDGEKLDLRNGTLVVGFSGKDEQGTSFSGRLAAGLVQGKDERQEAPSPGEAGLPQVPAQLPKEARPQRTPVLSLTLEQRRTLADAAVWGVEVAHDYPHKRDEFPVTIENDCLAILRRAGWTVDASQQALLLKVRIDGTAKSGNYSGSPSVRFTGAEVTISGAILTTEDSPRTLVSLQSVRGEVPTPYSVYGGYVTPQEAPFAEAAHNAREFYLQLFELVHAVRGPQAVYECARDKALDHQLRHMAFNYIALSGDRSFVPLLIQELELQTDDTWTASAVDCLGALRDPRAVEHLTARLMDKTLAVNRNVADALARIGDRKAVPSLRAALVAADSGHEAAAEALAELAWQPDTPQEKVLYFLAVNQDEKVRQMKDQATPVLLELLKKEGWKSKEAAQMLGTLKNPAATEALSNALLAAGDPGLRSACAISLAEIGGEKAAEALAIALRTDSDSYVRQTCADAIGRLRGAAPIAALTQAAASDSSEQVVLAAVRALAATKDGNAVDSLLRGLHHQNQSVRQAAAEGLCQFKEARVIQGLQTQAAVERDPGARRAMIQAMVRMGVDSKGMPLDVALRMLAEEKRYDRLRSLLDTQPTPKLVESLRLEEDLVTKTAEAILSKRSGRSDLHGYAAWQAWWTSQPQAIAPGAAGRPTPAGQ